MQRTMTTTTANVNNVSIQCKVFEVAAQEQTQLQVF